MCCNIEITVCRKLLASSSIQVPKDEVKGMYRRTLLLVEDKLKECNNTTAYPKTSVFDTIKVQLLHADCQVSYSYFERTYQPEKMNINLYTELLKETYDSYQKALKLALAISNYSTSTDGNTCDSSNSNDNDRVAESEVIDSSNRHVYPHSTSYKLLAICYSKFGKFCDTLIETLNNPNINTTNLATSSDAGASNSATNISQNTSKTTKKRSLDISSDNSSNNPTIILSEQLQQTLATSSLINKQHLAYLTVSNYMHGIRLGDTQNHNKIVRMAKLTAMYTDTTMGLTQFFEKSWIDKLPIWVFLKSASQLMGCKLCSYIFFYFMLFMLVHDVVSLYSM